MSVFAAAELSKNPRTPITRFDVIRTLAGLILLIAAGLKAHQLATEPVANRDIFSYRWSMTAMVEFEIVFGLWLLSGLHKRLSWLLAILCFSGFSVVTIYKALSGESSCGCFGRVQVNPWYTLIFDVTVVLALLIFRPSPREGRLTRHYRLKMAVTVGLALIAGIPAGLLMSSYAAAITPIRSTTIGESKFIILEPRLWVGGDFPLLEHIKIDRELARGKWLVVLYRDDCSGCAEALPKCEQMAERLAVDKDFPQIALIAVPPYEKDSPANLSKCVRGRLLDSKEWFVETPAIILLADSKVIKTWKEELPELQVVLQSL